MVGKCSWWVLEIEMSTGKISEVGMKVITCVLHPVRAAHLFFIQNILCLIISYQK